MENKSWIIIRVLLNRFHEGSAEQILSNLPENDRNGIMNIEAKTKNVKSIFIDPLQAIANIHYSWLVVPLQNLPKETQPYVLAALSPVQRTNLSKMIASQFKPLSIPERFKFFFCNQLASQLGIDKVLPVEYLPQTPLKSLLEFNKNQLIELIDFLGLFDLAVDVRQIVDKRQLKQVYDCLNRKKQIFLRGALHQIDKLNPPKIGVDQMLGDCKKLEMQIHRRGLVRFALGLSSQHPDFLWYIFHVLDTGRSNIVAKYIKTDENPHLIAAMTAQIINTINFLMQNPEY